MLKRGDFPIECKSKWFWEALTVGTLRRPIGWVQGYTRVHFLIRSRFCPWHLVLDKSCGKVENALMVRIPSPHTHSKRVEKDRR
jgi:hypothetical protein